MTATQQRKTRSEERDPAEAPRVLSFLILAGAILGVLLLGAGLRTDAPADRFGEVDEASTMLDAPAPTPFESADTDAADDFLPPESMLDRMAGRASADVARLALDADG